MNADLAGAQWRKSSYSSGSGGNCVEVATNLPGLVAVRDSKDPGAPPCSSPPPNGAPSQQPCAQADADSCPTIQNFFVDVTSSHQRPQAASAIST